MLSFNVTFLNMKKIVIGNILCSIKIYEQVYFNIFINIFILIIK